MRYIRVLFIFLVATFGFLPSGRCENADNLSLFYQGNLAYKDGRYAEATADYEKILANGFESGPLYYNLANSYYKQGKVGQAVLNYERAKRLMPRDNDLRANASFAQSLVQLRVKPSPQPLWADLFKKYALSITGNAFGLWLLFLYAGGWLFFILSKMYKWPRQAVRVTLCAVGIMFFVNVCALWQQVHYYRDLAVVLKEADARFEPLKDATVYFSLSEGTEVRILKKEGQWLKVRRPDDKVGWVPQETVERI